jgi:DNA polymerase-4
VARSRSRQRTFARDLTDRADLTRELTVLAGEVAADVAVEDRDARRVAIIVRFASFFTITRSTTLPAPTRDKDVIAAAAVDLLDKLDPHRPIRLLGVRAELVGP